MNLSELAELIEFVEFNTIDMNNASEIIREILKNKKEKLVFFPILCRIHLLKYFTLYRAVFPYT